MLKADYSTFEQDLVSFIDESRTVQNLSQKMLSKALEHGLTPLIYQWRKDSGLTGLNLATPENQQLKESAHLSEAVYMVRMEVLNELLDAAEQAKLRLLILKGFHFAHTLYSSAGLRPCVDIDLFYDDKDRHALVSLLEEQGFKVEGSEQVSLLSPQFMAYKTTQFGHTVVLDLHYQINGQNEFSAIFQFERMFDESVLLPEVHDSARVLSMHNAYLLACVHIHGHYLEGEAAKAIWLKDIELLFASFSQEEISTLQSALDESQRLKLVCCYWSQTAINVFDSSVDISTVFDNGSIQQSRLKFTINPISRLWRQFIHLQSLHQRIKFIRQLVFPIESVVREKYPNSKLWLPLLYIRRIASGMLNRVLRWRKNTSQ